MFLTSRRVSAHLKKWHQSGLAYSTSQTVVPEKCPLQPSAPPSVEVKRLSYVDSAEDYKKALSFSQLPGPSAFSLLWNMIVPGRKYYKMGIKDLHHAIYKEYGNIVKFPLMGRDPMVILYDAHQVEKVFRNEGQWPNRMGLSFFNEFRKNRPEIFHGMGGLLQDQGKQWQETRTKVNPVMIQPRTVHRYVPTVDEIASDFVARIREIRDDKNEAPADFGNEMNKWSLESIAYIALDQRLGLLNNIAKDSDGQRLIQDVHDFFQLSYELEIQPSIWKLYHTSTYKRAMKCLNSMTDIIISFIDKSIVEMEKKSKDGTTTNEESVLETLLKIDKRIAVIMALDMLMAGVDTTSNTVLSLLNSLAQNPDKQQLLRQEIMEKLPRKDSPLTADAMKNMPYLRACMKESQRLLPVVLGTVRKLPTNIVLQGYQIPNKYYIAMSGTVMGAKEDIFKQADKFIPERFLKINADPQLKPTQPFAHLPFGYGPRMCIGKRLAQLEMEAVTARLIRNFRVEWHYPEIKYASNMLQAPTGDLKFRFEEVDE